MNRIKAPVKKFVDLTKLTGLLKSKVNCDLHFRGIKGTGNHFASNSGFLKP